MVFMVLCLRLDQVRSIWLLHPREKVLDHGLLVGTRLYPRRRLQVLDPVQLFPGEEADGPAP